MSYHPTIHILLATYNGAKYLQEQLESLAQQKYKKWTLTISDDGSTDETIEIIKAFAKKRQEQIRLLQGPSIGSSTRNFFHLIKQIPVENKEVLYAFCDQDDVWLNNKLVSAVQWHASQLDDPIRLYCGRTQYVNKQLKPISLSSNVGRHASFANALVQNIASGNTMVFNSGVLAALKKIHPENSVWHDWTTYLITTAIGGSVGFDDKAHVLYRQHETNVIGANNGLISKIFRLKSLFKGRYKKWNDTNLSALYDINKEITPSSQKLLKNFCELRALEVPNQRIKSWLKTPIRRQTPVSNLSLGFAIFLGLV